MQTNVEKKENLPNVTIEQNKDKIINARITIKPNKIDEKELNKLYCQRIIKIIDQSPFNLELFSRIKKELGNVRINEVNTGTNNYEQIKITLNDGKEIDIGIQKDQNNKSKVIFANFIDENKL